VAVCACSNEPAAPPKQGVLLLALNDGSYRGRADLGQDPLAVSISPDGNEAYVVDNTGGFVFAVSLPNLRVRWSSKLDGAPTSIVTQDNSLWISLYTAGQVVQLDRRTGNVVDKWAVGPGPGAIVFQQGQAWTATSAGLWQVKGHKQADVHGFGVASVGGTIWAADYDKGQVVRVSDGQIVSLPSGLHPFWLAAGSSGNLLVAAEGADEDRDLGAVLSLAPPTYEPRSLTRATDPDQVVEAGGKIFVASHGDRQVDVLTSSGDHAGTWGKGAAAVALAVDDALGLLVVVTDERE
jgi:DNA-binding beta-propeller fold protein YncE